MYRWGFVRPRQRPADIKTTKLALGGCLPCTVPSPWQHPPSSPLIPRHLIPLTLPVPTGRWGPRTPPPLPQPQGRQLRPHPVPLAPRHAGHALQPHRHPGPVLCGRLHLPGQGVNAVVFSGFGCGHRVACDLGFWEQALSTGRAVQHAAGGHQGPRLIQSVVLQGRGLQQWEVRRAVTTCGRPWPELFQAGAGVVWQSQEAQGSQVVMGMVTSQVGTGWHAPLPAPQTSREDREEGP